ncbi:MAG: L,D-transpeptidase family protein [Candidatus Binatia bacterium]
MRRFAILCGCMLALVPLARLCVAQANQSDTAWPLLRAEGRLADRFASRGLPFPPRSVALIALKSEARLELWAEAAHGWAFVRSYLVQATSGRLGPKLREGDHQVPEGVYRVSGLNPQSLYHRALALDYPNAFDKARGREEGRGLLGGDIMIHGGSVSDGCVPVGDEAIEELFALALRVGVTNVAVVISPMDLRRIPAALAVARAVLRPPWLADLYDEVARTLHAFPLPSVDLNDTVDRLGVTEVKGTAPCNSYDPGDCMRLCERGDATSCARAGVLYRGGRGIAADVSKAWALLRRACASGSALGCGALSELVLHDDGLQRDVARAAALARTACQGGDGHGCTHLAQLCNGRLFYADSVSECSDEHVMWLRQRAVAALASNCTGWAAYDCYTLATIYVPGDPGTAIRFAAASCSAGDAGGCDLLGALTSAPATLGFHGSHPALPLR